MNDSHFDDNTSRQLFPANSISDMPVCDASMDSDLNISNNNNSGNDAPPPPPTLPLSSSVPEVPCIPIPVPALPAEMIPVPSGIAQNQMRMDGNDSPRAEATTRDISHDISQEHKRVRIQIFLLL